MFAENKYTKCYNKIVGRAKDRDIDGYFERHHVIPKSLGGTNKKENLVKLTAKEHFICHLLLVKMLSGDNKKKMARALWLMAKGGKNRYHPSSRSYEFSRKEFIDAQVGHPNYLKSQTKEARKRIGESVKKLLSQMSPQELTDRMKKSWCHPDSYTPERIENMRKGMIGKKKTKTPALLEAERLRKIRIQSDPLKCGDSNRGKTWKLIDGKRVWTNKENQI